MWMKDDPRNDYVNDSQMYKRKIPNQSKKWLRVVKDWGDIQGQNHHVHCDNFFLSVKLFEVLLQNVAYACGTIWKHRRVLSKVIKDTRGTWWQQPDMTSIHWKQKTVEHFNVSCLRAIKKKSTLSTWMVWTVQTSSELLHWKEVQQMVEVFVVFYL